MNVFFKGTIEAGFDIMKAQVDADMAGEAVEFCTEYRLADLGGGEVMMCANVTDFEKMGAFMNDPERLQWDKDNGAVYKVHMMNEMTE